MKKKPQWKPKGKKCKKQAKPFKMHFKLKINPSGWIKPHKRPPEKSYREWIEEVRNKEQEILWNINSCHLCQWSLVRLTLCRMSTLWMSAAMPMEMETITSAAINCWRCSRLCCLYKLPTICISSQPITANRTTFIMEIIIRIKVHSLFRQRPSFYKRFTTTLSSSSSNNNPNSNSSSRTWAATRTALPTTIPTRPTTRTIAGRNIKCNSSGDITPI